ncbi:ATP synthase F0 subunit C [Dictyobacter arantiisoli]|uniref:ATP synthase subunit c n=1 Tax=Dictyobacter arantiisoli TaxID=2014874 RepID=A0A5A5TK25_9CHLR|nr:ATP synthase F0 subunit C [Dictyobacter arantiisoli]GCF11379.1 hypothetical protein KDI_49430 [Dictyobacter arantiisoli]
MGIYQAIGVALAIGLGGIGAGLAMGMANGKAYEALGRNPEAAPAIRMNFLLGLVFAETIAVYALLVAFLLLFR